MRYRIDAGNVRPYSFYIEVPFVECYVADEIPFVQIGGAVLSFEDDISVWEIYKSGTSRAIFDSRTWGDLPLPGEPDPFGPDTREEAAL